MDRFVLSIVLIAAMVAACGIASAAPPAPPSECGINGQTKLDVAVYETTNKQGNPIHELPDDNTVFTFRVVWHVKTVTDGGQLVSDVTQVVGTFTSSQDETNGFCEIYGAPYEKDVSVCVWWYGPICVWHDPGTETGYYFIEPYIVPAGYCPQYPSQDRTKDGTQTVNEKFFMGPYCGGIYPGYNGDYGGGSCAPKKCYILIQ